MIMEMKHPEVIKVLRYNIIKVRKKKGKKGKKKGKKGKKKRKKGQRDLNPQIIDFFKNREIGSTI